MLVLVFINKYHSSEMYCYLHLCLIYIFIKYFSNTFSTQNYVSHIGYYIWDTFLILVIPRYPCTELWNVFHRAVHQHRYECEKEIEKACDWMAICVCCPQKHIPHILVYTCGTYFCFWSYLVTYALHNGCLYSSSSTTAQIWV